MPLSRNSLLAAGEDPSGSESDGESAEDAEPITVPPLLPVPASLAKPNDRLCYTCTALELTPRRFVVTVMRTGTNLMMTISSWDLSRTLRNDPTRAPSVV